jgi:hypothetical protein
MYYRGCIAISYGHVYYVCVYTPSTDTSLYCVWQAQGPQGLYDAIEHGDVSRVALGPHDTWLVLYKDGSQVSGLITI